MHNATLDLDAVHTAQLRVDGIPPFGVRYTYRAILAMEDAGPILAKIAANRSPNASTNPSPTQQAILEECVLSA